MTAKQCKAVVKLLNHDGDITVVLRCDLNRGHETAHVAFGKSVNGETTTLVWEEKK